MKGFDQIGAPASVRSSSRIPPAESRAKAAIEAANQRRGRCGRPPVGKAGAGGGEGAVGAGVDMCVDIRIPP
ncbi:hypothetical protein GCM10017667_63940 [Streptomyces filamentosus]|uniref:Uncharacterized protein n=1 Tax=Streptomyces filamentosus TaxID=67294 RepID=A0A919BVQ2_STRFL|nr:hypothetical protein GCM10017667_63940 [Streptomyces filamentosus]